MHCGTWSPTVLPRVVHCWSLAQLLVWPSWAWNGRCPLDGALVIFGSACWHVFLVASQILHWLAHWDRIQDERSISFICLRSMLAATAHHDRPVFLSNFPHFRNEFHQIAWGISKLWLQRLYVATSLVWLGSWHSKLSAWAFRWQNWPRVQSKVEVVVKVCGWIWETSMKGIPTCRRISLTWFNHQNHWLKSLIAEKVFAPVRCVAIWVNHCEKTKERFPPR